MTRHLAAVVAVVGGSSAAALAQPTVFVSEDDVLHRFLLGDAPTSFTLDDRVRGLTARQDGSLFAVSPVNPDNGEPEFYEILNPYSNQPTLTPTSVQTDFGWSAVTEIGDVLYGVGSDGDLFLIDPANSYTPTLIGYTGLTDVGGLAYDPLGDRLIALDNDTDAIYPVDRNTGAAGSGIGSLGVDSLASGLEWFDGGLYAAIQNGTADEFQVGLIDLNTGAYSSVQTLEQGAVVAATSIAVVPTPGAGALLAVAGIGALRRRR